MNVALLIQIAEWLEAGAPPDPIHNLAGFSMGDFMLPVPCGSVCCIAGTAIALSGDHGDADQIPPALRPYARQAGQLLGLSKWDSDQLFYASGSGISLKSIDESWAARCIRHLIATGEVNWVGTREPA